MGVLGGDGVGDAECSAMWVDCWCDWWVAPASKGAVDLPGRKEGEGGTDESRHSSAGLGRGCSGGGRAAGGTNKGSQPEVCGEAIRACEVLRTILSLPLICAKVVLPIPRHTAPPLLAPLIDFCRFVARKRWRLDPTRCRRGARGVPFPGPFQAPVVVTFGSASATGP